MVQCHDVGACGLRGRYSNYILPKTCKVLVSQELLAAVMRPVIVRSNMDCHRDRLWVLLASLYPLLLNC